MPPSESSSPHDDGAAAGEPLDGSGPARGARKRQQTRTKILEAAESLLTELEADQVSIAGVAGRAGVAPASVYSHFGTKDMLLAATAQRLVEVTAQAHEAAYDVDLAPADRLAHAGIAYLDLLLRHPALAKYFLILRRPGTQVGRDLDISANLVQMVDDFEQRIQEVVDDGAWKPIDARLMSRFLFSAWNGLVTMMLRTDDLAMTADEVVRTVTMVMETLTEGLAGHQMTPPSNLEGPTDLVNPRASPES